MRVFEEESRSSSRLLTLHIGLRKTGSTFLQQKFFLPVDSSRLGHPVLRLPYSIDGDRSRERIKRGSPQQLQELVQELSRQINSQAGCRAAIISSENLAVSEREPSNLGDRLSARDFQPFRWSELPLLNQLVELRSIASRHQLTIRVLIGIRRQDEILAAEYAQQSYNLLFPSQRDFESKVRTYLGFADEYLEYSKLFTALSEILGGHNVLMYDLPTLRDRRAIEAIGEFCGLSGMQALKDWSRVNSLRSGRNSWSLRGYLGATNRLNLQWSFHRRGRIFMTLRPLARLMDWVFRKLLPPPMSIQMTQSLTNLTRKRYAASNKNLIELSTKYPEQIFLARGKWFFE